MSIEINNPEIEAFIHKRLESGVFESVEEVLLSALDSQDAEEALYSSHCRDVSDKIDRAIAEMERGEGMTAEQSKAWLDARKAEHKLKQFSE